MNKITHVPLKIILSLGVIAVVALLWVGDIGCPLYQLSGIPCPGCGMTRALVSACRLDFRAAFAHHPMFWALPFLYASFLFDFRPFRKQWLNLAILLAGGAGFAVVYTFRLMQL